MDPKANLEEQKRLAATIIQNLNDGCDVSEYDAARLAELVIALDEWISNGGCSPWARGH